MDMAEVSPVLEFPLTVRDVSSLPVVAPTLPLKVNDFPSPFEVTVKVFFPFIVFSNVMSAPEIVVVPPSCKFTVPS